MKRQAIFSIFFLLFSSAFALGQEQDTPSATVRMVKLADLEALITKDDNKTRIINFWATWCRPCVAEMPHFEEVGQAFANKDVEVIFVSLDFPDNLETRVAPFVKRKNIQSQVVLLDEDDASVWMPAIEPTWQGNIPATLIVNNKQGIREFHGKELSKAELETLIEATF